MRLFLISALFVITGCSAFVPGEFLRLNETTMTLEQRIEFNSAPWSPECVFAEDGKAINADAGILGCWDGRTGALMGQDYAVNLVADHKVPDGITVVRLDTVSAAEISCHAATGFYVRACSLLEQKIIIAVHGDTQALIHEQAHFIRSDYHL